MYPAGKVSNNTGVFSTCTWLWLKDSEEALPPSSLNKDMVQNSV